jgi:glycosyltransferase involved in cell wall biosynthesis
MIKGYTGFVGRADLALEACRIAAETIKGFEIILYSSDVKSRRIARQLSIEKGLNITMFRKHELGHEQMLDFFRNSRIYIGISESDGISTSLLDAISSGCYPIQTNTSCANEWVADGVTGSLVDLHDIHGISAAIENAIKNDHLVDAASHLNIKTARTRLSSESIGQDIHQFYELF